MHVTGVWNLWAKAPKDVGHVPDTEDAPSNRELVPLPPPPPVIASPSTPPVLTIQAAGPINELNAIILDDDTEKIIFGGMEDKQRPEEFQRFKALGRTLIKSTIVSELFKHLPDVTANALEKKAAKALMAPAFLATVAAELGLPKRISATGNNVLILTPTTMADTFQAFVGGIFVKNNCDMGVIDALCRKALAKQLALLASADVDKGPNTTNALANPRRDKPAENHQAKATDPKDVRNVVNRKDDLVVTSVPAVAGSQKSIASAIPTGMMLMTPPQSQERREAEPAIAKSLSVVASKPAGASVSHAPTPQTRKPVAAVPTIQNSSIHTSRNQMQMVPRSVPFGGDNGYSARANGDRDLFPSRQEFSAPSRMHETQRGGVDSRVGTGAGPPRSVYERPVPYVRTYQERRTQPRGRPADRLQNGRKTRNQKKGPPHRALQSDGLTPNELRARDGLPPRKRKAEELDDGELDYGEPEPAGKKAKNGLRALEGDKLKLDDYMRNRHPQVDVCYKPFDLFTLGKPSNGVRNIEIPLQIGAPFNISVTGAGPTSAAAEENAATQALARLSAVPGAGSIGG